MSLSVFSSSLLASCLVLANSFIFDRLFSSFFLANAVFLQLCSLNYYMYLFVQLLYRAIIYICVTQLEDFFFISFPCVLVCVCMYFFPSSTTSVAFDGKFKYECGFANNCEICFNILSYGNSVNHSQKPQTGEKACRYNESVY